MVSTNTLDKITLNPQDEFDSTLIKIKEIHDKKKADYSKVGDRFSNFEYAAKAAKISTMQSFEVLIGVKQARLIELFQPGKLVLNESIADTLIDRAIYCILAYTYYLYRVDPERKS